MSYWDYDRWPSGEPYDWLSCARESEHDRIDFHLDLGCGTLKKGRIGIDRHPAPGVNICMDLDRMILYGMTFVAGQDVRSSACSEKGSRVEGLPFEDASIESIITHHFLEHVGDGFVRLIDECHRVLRPGGVLRAITPLFPGRTAVEDPDHRRYFMYDTWQTFCGAENGEHWHEAFSVPYTKSRFHLTDKECTPCPYDPWGPDGAREIRVTLEKW